LPLCEITSEIAQAGAKIIRDRLNRTTSPNITVEKQSVSKDSMYGDDVETIENESKELVNLMSKTIIEQS